MSENTVVKEALQLYADLQELKNKFLNKVGEQNPSFTAEEWQQHTEQGIYLLKYCLPDVDVVLCRELVEEICSLLAAEQPAKKEQVELIKSYFKDVPEGFFTEIIKEEHKVLAQQSLFSPEEYSLMNLIVRHALRPFMEKYVESIPREVGGEKWQRNYCPVCGEKANLSYLRLEDGKRVLICPFCGQEWLYRYLACSWCGNKDHKSIRYFEAIEIPGYEVYLCDRCKCYLKTFNTKKGVGHDDWILEDVKTISLDFIAQKEGYKGPYSQVQCH